MDGKTDTTKIVGPKYRCEGLIYAHPLMALLVSLIFVAVYFGVIYIIGYEIFTYMWFYYSTPIYWAISYFILEAYPLKKPIVVYENGLVTFYHPPEYKGSFPLSSVKNIELDHHLVCLLFEGLNNEQIHFCPVELEQLPEWEEWVSRVVSELPNP